MARTSSQVSTDRMELQCNRPLEKTLFTAVRQLGAHQIPFPFLPTSSFLLHPCSSVACPHLCAFFARSFQLNPPCPLLVSSITALQPYSLVMAVSDNWSISLVVLLCSALFVNASSLASVTISSVSSMIANATTSCKNLTLPRLTLTNSHSAVTVTGPTSSTEKCHGQCEIAPWCSWPQGEVRGGYAMHCGLDFYRGDMHDQRVASVDLCVKLCDITPGCTAMSYESSTEDGLNGMCWLKNGIIGGFQRPRKWIVGMYKADLALSSPIPAWFRPRPVGMPSATAWSTLMSTLSRSVSVTTTHSPEANAFVTPTGAVSVATVKSPSITSSSKPSATADQGQSGGRTSIGPPFWFTEAHPCYPSECRFPSLMLAGRRTLRRQPASLRSPNRSSRIRSPREARIRLRSRLPSTGRIR